MLRFGRHIKQTLVVAVLAVTMTGCADNDEPDIVYGGTIMLNVGIGNMQLETLSRANIKALTPETIGVYADIKDLDQSVFDNQCMYYKYGKEIDNSGLNKNEWTEDNNWVYNPPKSWIADREYSFYAYSPYMSGNKTEMKITGPTTRSFLLHDIPPLSATEYLVGKDEIKCESGAKPPLLELTHITSRLRFLFAIDAEYLKLRDIEVTSIKISDSGNNTPYWDCEVQISSSTQINITKSNKIYKSTADIKLMPESAEFHKLTTEYSSFSSAYNLLGQISNTELTVTYNVYDKSGQLLREDQNAKNVVDLSGWTFERGKCYDVRVLVCPKYLYVLSDNDVAPNLVVDTENQSTTP